ncbi:hypothetical protein C7S17_0794 [Burkholderia thailandensis]|nr:hypothetical protein [Burkholderia thailandensis]
MFKTSSLVYSFALKVVMSDIRSASSTPAHFSHTKKHCKLESITLLGMSM